MRSIRSTRDVLDDHLRRRAAGDLDGDLAANYHPDVLILHPAGQARGHGAVRRLARDLCRYEPDESFRCHRLLAAEDVGVLEWSGLGGCTDTLTMEGMESFVVRDGLIVAQTIHLSSSYLAAA